MARPPHHRSPRDTSWQEVGEWYNSNVGEQGHYYHQHVIWPNLFRLVPIKDESSVLDIGCGQGVLARQLSESVEYVGLDAAQQLIAFARKSDPNPRHEYLLQDATHFLSLKKKNFSHAFCILALQNISHPEKVCLNAFNHLGSGGSFTLVLNHPAFRIPRQSSWGVDQNNKTQYRRVDRYLSPLKIPITAHPGQNKSAVTWSFHWPLSHYFQILTQAGFVITAVEEWVSDKSSEGKAAKMENRSRQEFPLFLTIVATKP